MKLIAVRRVQMAQTGKTDVPLPPTPPPHPGYAPNAALHAIKRHAQEFAAPKAQAVTRTIYKRIITSISIKICSKIQKYRYNQLFILLQMSDEKEGPVTKSIRLTSSLILKNLVMYSNLGKK